MKKTGKLISMLLVMLMVIGMTTAVGAEVTSLSGEGTQANPFKIGTAEELMFAANQSNSDDLETRNKYGGYWSGSPASRVYYKITADIDMTDKEFPGFGRADIGATNLGSYGKGFLGMIYGDGHVISNLTVTVPSAYPAGFICHTAMTAIADLGLENVTITAGTSAGAFIGMDRYYGMLQGCYVKNLTNNADGTSGNKKGALVGSTNVATGSAAGVTFINCYSINAGAQGIMGLNSGIATANATNCYTTGAGDTTQMTNYYRNVAESQYADPVANKFVSGKLTADKLNAQFTSIDAGARNDSVFVADEFDINNGFPVLAWQNVGRIKLEGSGTQADPFLIGTADELMFAANQSNSTDAETNYKYCGNYNGKGKVYYKITADIDMSGYDFPGFGRTDLASTISNMGGNGRGFYGEIYGDGHVIKNLTINAANASINVPLGFICCTWNSTVTDLGLENVKINGGTRIGGFAGYAVSSVTLQSCYVKGFNGTGTEKTGALLGFNNSSSTKCYFINCYSLDVTGGRGIIDYNGVNVDVAKTVADFTNCYTSAFNNFQVGTTTYNSFYYNVASNSYVQAGASTTTGKLSADMLQAVAVNLKTGDHIRTDCNFVADEFGINGGFPVLAWQNEGLVKPGFPNDYTSVIKAYDPIEGYNAFYIYAMLNNFNTSAEGMEYGVKFGVKDEENKPMYLPSCTEEDGIAVTMTPVAGQAYIIRVYGPAIVGGKTYTMTPYIGKDGAYTYGSEAEYTVPAAE